MRYFFILGRNPELSLAELYAVLPRGYETVCVSKQVFIAECSDFDVEKLMKRLGGTIKIGTIQKIKSQSPTGSGTKVKNDISNFISSTPAEQKIFLGISAYALDNKTRLPDAHQLRQIGIEIKRDLQAQGRKARLVTSKDIALSSVIVEKQKLLRQGAEIVLIFNCSAALYVPLGRGIKPRATSYGDILIGKTLAVQEFEQASRRDYGRPIRAMEVGMLPIQLAKIMINLARAPKSATILDPFCGLGTILSEASMMGYQSLVGSDISSDMVRATKQNLEWLGKELGITNYELGVKLFCSPAENLSKHLKPASVDAIVTEPYLGPMRGIRNHELGIMDELKSLYTKAFREFVKILKPGGRVVFIFPIFVTERRRSSLSDEILPQIKKLGFQPIPLLQKNSAFSITYSRPDQKVLRQIFVFEFKQKP